jgi:undecaprenyl-diphosphatase
MNLLFAIAAGVLQGLTEFLPVSSTGHLVILHDILRFDAFDNALFDVAVHLGTILALLIFFRGDVIRLIRGFARSFVRRDLKNDEPQRLSWLIAVALIPAVAVGYFFQLALEGTVRNPLVVSGALIAVALLFFAAERHARQEKDLGAMTVADAAAVGVAQVLAFVPGVSRSGITILAGLSRRMKRAEAARFSMLLSIPTIVGAGLLKGLKIDWAGADWPVLIVGFAAAFISGFLTIRLFLRFLTRYPLNVFAWYRIGLGILVALWVLVLR